MWWRANQRNIGKGKMPFFGKSKNPEKKPAASQQKSSSGRNHNENMYTTILASKTQKRLAGQVMRALERTREVNVEGKGTVIRRSSDKQGCSEEFLEYMKLQRVTGVVILSSDELGKFLKGDNSVALQITGEDVDLDSSVISKAFMANSDIKSKILIAIPEGTVDNCNLHGVDVVQLKGDESSWNKSIVSKFSQKIELRS